jgi:TonB-linked SusC/RagA family outer membrane protein
MKQNLHFKGILCPGIYLYKKCIELLESKVFRIMKLTGIILLVLTIHVNAASFGQKISISQRNTNLKMVFKEIRKQTGFYFIYSNEVLQKAKPLNVDVTNVDLDEVLKDVFSNQPLTYTIQDKIIIVKSKDFITPNLKNVSAPVLVDIKGKVIDVNGQPLPGVSVIVVGTTKGATTNTEGYYAIDASPGDILKFSMVGYIEQEIKVQAKTAIDIVLKEKLSDLDEVMVVGMGVQRKASVIGAISTVKMDDLKIPVRSLTNALAGKMAGAVVVQRSGELGRDGGGLWIRGIATFGANRSPLILVDGVERSMDDISVEEVESVSILKDASATAVYGVRAANGVVLVTTRRGIAQAPVIEFKTEYGISDLPMLPKFLNGPDYATLYNEALGRENYSKEYIENTRNGIDPYLYPNVNWFDETYKKYAQNANATLNVRGGGEVARYFVGLGYIKENGNLKDNPDNDYKSNLDLQRYNFRANIDVTLSKSTILELEIGGNLTDLRTPGVGGTIYSSTFTPAGELFYWAYQASPIGNPVRIPIGKDLNGNDIMGWAAPTQVGESNPVERLMGSGFNTEFRNQFTSQISLNQDLKSVLDGLKFRLSYSFDANNTTTISRRKNSTTYGVQGRDPVSGDLLFKEVTVGTEFLGYTNGLTSNRAKEMKAQLLYNKAFGEKHHLGGMMMYYQRDYILGNAGSAILSLPYRRQGIAGRATYDYDDRYFAEFNVGYNGSENFPPEKRFGWFPAVAAGWIISNESFFKNLKGTVDLLKIKGSVGLVGSEALPGSDRYGYLSVYGAGLGGYIFGETPTNYGGTGENRIGVATLTWEKGLKKNIGFELKMFKNALSIEADYFHEKRTDILLQRTSLPAITGYVAAPYANMGEMLNRGVDGTVEFNQRFGDVGTRVYGNFTYARDKILSQDEANKNYAYRMRTGNKYNQVFGLIDLGYFVSEADIKNSPEQQYGVVRPGDVKYLDVNGDGKVNVDDEVPIGYSNLPEINYGFGFQVDYKGFDVGVFLRGQGRVSYALGGSYIPFAQGVGKLNLFEEALDRWTVDSPRQDALYPRIYNGTSSNNWQRSTKTIYNGRYLRLSDIEVGYTFGAKILSGIKLKSLRLYALANNVAVWAPWKMWDPELEGPGNYPLQRKMNLGIRAKF